MSDTSGGERLSRSRYMSLVLRLLVDPDGEVDSGELVDLDGRQCGRFIGLDGLVPKLRQCIADLGASGEQSDETGN